MKRNKTYNCISSEDFTTFIVGIQQFKNLIRWNILLTQLKNIYFKVYPFLTASEYNVIRRDETPNQYWGEDGQNYNCMKEKKPNHNS